MNDNPSTHPAATPEAIAKRMATMKAKREARQACRGYPMPLVLKCIVTGKVVKYTVPRYIEKRIAEAGGLENLYATYVSREGKKLQETQGTPPAPG